MGQSDASRLAPHRDFLADSSLTQPCVQSVYQTEILHSPPLSQLPKNSLKAPAHDPTDSSSAAAYASLPNPSAAQPLKAPDQRFQESEAFTNKFEKHLSGSMERVNRRVMKRWGGQSDQLDAFYVPRLQLT